MTIGITVPKKIKGTETDESKAYGFIKANMPFIIKKQFPSFTVKVDVTLKGSMCCVDIALPQVALTPRETLYSIYNDLIALSSANGQQISALELEIKYSKL